MDGVGGVWDVGDFDRWMMCEVGGEGRREWNGDCMMVER